MGRHLERYQGQGDQTNVFGSLVTVMTDLLNADAAAPKSPLSTTGISVAYLHMNGVCRIQIQLITEGLMHMYRYWAVLCY
ncbi:hypothetical protein FOC1_g10014838 [Fusarium oxysporum f. sp. cubense race 1]|uniref:Uncharacterized protein n=1 Tax=Fusarium oxysporum f. sp. cubense (strain race 1) TaxID=1229664 RepID=N4TZ97_FUSC1|nr:hypothetical protein FOC1_g10014838 [Fusarium oxysporum f. sp. cubense race 1]